MSGVTLGKLLSAGKNRVDILFSLKKENEGDERATLHECGEEELLGHFALRLTAALSENRIFKNWFLESEGDLFERRFRGSSYKEKVQETILRDLFGEIRIGWSRVLGETNMDRETLRKEIRSVLKREPRSRIIAFPFEKVPEMLKERKGVLVNGWLVTSQRRNGYYPSNISSAAKKGFQRQLEEKIEEVAETVARQKKDENDLKPLAKKLANYWKKNRKQRSFRSNFEGEELEDRKLYERVDLFPLCMSLLYRDIKVEGYLSHEGRLQLGFFLKELGMSVEEQLQFWYENSVDDAGMSWKEFKNGPGYQVRHIYGLVGGGIDYNAPKCETIINRYFCPFASLPQMELKEELSSEGSSSAKNRIVEKARNGSYQTACGIHLQEKHGTNSKRGGRLRIYHPLQYVKESYNKSENGEVEGNHEKQGKN